MKLICVPTLCGATLLAGALGPLAHAANIEMVCALAPSQSTVGAGLVGTTGGAAAIMTAVGKAMGMTVVAHSSGELILTGSAGYIAGSMGVASSVPIVITVGVVAASVAATVELVCAPRNHPAQVAQIAAAAQRIVRRTAQLFASTNSAIKGRVIPASVRVRALSANAFERAYLPVADKQPYTIAPPLVLQRNESNAAGQAGRRVVARVRND